MSKTENEIQMEQRTWRLKFLNKASEIAKWNKETFVDATVDDQLLKLSDLDFKRKTKDQTALRLAQIKAIFR